MNQMERLLAGCIMPVDPICYSRLCILSPSWGLFSYSGLFCLSGGDPCRPAKENGLIQSQKSLFVKVQTLWKSSWAKAISGSNKVTEAWLPMESSFTVDQLCLKVQALQVKRLGQSFSHFSGPQSLQSLLEKPFPQQWHIAGVSFVPSHLFLLKTWKLHYLWDFYFSVKLIWN